MTVIYPILRKKVLAGVMKRVKFGTWGSEAESVKSRATIALI